MRLLMMGTGTFAEPTFRALLEAGETVVGLVTQPDRAPKRAGASTRLSASGMAAIAKAAGVPVARPESVNSPEGLEALRAFSPELLVVAAYGQILSREVLAVPASGAVNVHASLLPKHRGAAPIAHAILAGDGATGVSIIRITPGLDAGEVLAQGAEIIRDDDTTGSLEPRLAELGARLCLGVVRKMQAGPVPGVRQDAALVTKAPKFAKEFGLIDWSHAARDLERRVRALQPWPGAYTFLRRAGKPSVRLTISKADCQDAPGEPGAVLGADAGGLLVATGRGSLRLTEVQPAGGRRMAGGDFANGLRLTPADVPRCGAES